MRDSELAERRAEMAAFDALPAEARAVVARSLGGPPACMVASWISSYGLPVTLAKLEKACRELHDGAVRCGVIAPIKPGDSLSI